MLPAQKAIKTMKVLVVDAQEEHRLGIKARFEQDGYLHITVTDKGEDAIRLLTTALAARNPYDLIVLGMGLTDRPGLEAFSEIRGIFDVPVLLMVDRGERTLAIEAMGQGGVEYIQRPVDLRLLQIKTERVLIQAFLNRELRRSTERNETLFLNVLAVMAKVLEAKDPYTRFHSEKVSQLSTSVAREMGFSEQEVRRIGVAGILHDLGKIGIKESILRKAGPLDPDEREIVQRHPVIASTILEPIEQLQDALSYIRHHHEHFDGGGYPERLKGDAIPLGARIIHVAEAFDSMTSRRSYSQPKTPSSALEEMRRCSGTQFDPQVVEALVKALARGGKLTRGQAERPTRSLPELLRDLTGRVGLEDSSPFDSGSRSATPDLG